MARILPGVGLLLALLGILSPGTRADETPEERFAKKTPAEVRAFELEVMRQVADLALIPPTLNTAPLPKYDYDKLDYGMTIGIDRTPKGRLWACWVAGGDSPKSGLEDVAWVLLNSAEFNTNH